MPSRTLDSLSIEINANSQKASEGIDKLIGSLRSLRSCATTVSPSLRTLSNDLRAIAQTSKDIVKAADAVKAITRAVNSTKAKPGIIPEFKNAVKKDEFASWMYGPNPKPTVSSFNDSQGTYKPPNRPGFFSFENYKGKDWRQENAEDTEYFNKQIGEIISQQDALKNMKKNTEKMYEALQAGKGASSALPQGNPLENVTESAKEATEAVKPVQEALTSGLSNSANAATNALKGTDRELRQKKADGKAAKQGLDDVAKGAKNAKDAANGATDSMKKVGEASQEASKKGRSAGGIIGKIGNMFQSLVIRTALKSMIKAFGEAWNSAYEFSKHMGGDFAGAVDSIQTAFSSTAIAIVQTFAPVLQALVPVINVVASAIQYLCSGIQWLLGLLGMTSDLLGATDRQISRFGGSGSNHNNKKDKKGMLADWDELNIIQSQSGSGSSGGSGGSGPKISDFAKAEIDAVTSVLVGFGMMALGLIMCAAGHIPLGIGMIAVGAAAVIQTFAVRWGQMSDEVKKQVAQITLIASTAFLAIGLILAFTGHIGLGIAALAIGVAGIVGTVAVAWGSGVSDGIKQSIVKIMAIASVSLMAIGMILALTGVGTGIGIGMMAAGALMWYGAGSLDWDYLVELVANALETIKKVVKDVFERIKTVASDAWAKVCEWWNTNIGEPVKTAWNTVKTTVSGVFTTVKTKASSAWTTVSKWWNDNIGDPVKDAWASTQSFFATLFGNSTTDGSIAKFASDAWTSVKGWWASSTIGTTISSAWDTAKSYLVTFFGDPNDPTTIAGAFKASWDLASQWWGDIYTNISTAWGDVSTFFSTLWGGPGTGIYGFFETTWTEISQLWGDILTPVKTAWNEIGTWFQEHVTQPIQQAFTDAMNFVIDVVNGVIGTINAIGNFTIPGITISLPPWLGGATYDLVSEMPVSLWKIPEVEHLQVPQLASGGYDIPKGDLFIANEAGAELVGSMNGRTAVANQDQIVEGIRLGVRDANAEQNALLTRQNELLVAILQKSGSVNLEPSLGWGKHNQRSVDMWNKATGG